MQKKVIVIGSGFGGLCSAALLAKEGYDVTVLEKNPHMGGRAMTFDAKGFRFDMGPSWYLMPGVFENFFKLFGKNISDYVKLKPLDPMYRIFFSPDEHIDIVRDLNKNLATFEKMEKGASKSIQAYLDNAEIQYDIAIKHFLYTEFRSFLDFIKPEFFTLGGKVNAFKNLDAHISEYTNDDRLKKILGYTMVFLGGAPSNTPALYSLMSHVDYNLGVFYPEGGFGALTEAYVKLGKEYGVTYKTSTPVEEIVVKDGIAQGVKTKKGFIKADIVLSNADYHHTETALLSKEYRSYSPKYWESRTMAPSAFIIHLGIKGKIKNLKHHNLMLTHDWQKHFDEIFDDPQWPNKPSYYVCCPSKSDRSVAPEGSDVLFILVPVASGLKDTEAVRRKYYDKVMKDLELHTGESLNDRIVYERIYAHTNFTADYNAFKGTALGLAHTMRQTAILRPRSKSKKVKNMYFVGQYTQPGIGVPIVVISAQLVAERIRKDYA